MDYEDLWPSIPRTADDLAVRWAERDALYATQQPGLLEPAAKAVRLGRMDEARRLPRADRARMFTKAMTWTPPHHPDFGSLHSWLEDG